MLSCPDCHRTDLISLSGSKEYICSYCRRTTPMSEVRDAPATAQPNPAVMESFIRDLLDPEMYGYAMTAEVRDRARRCLGIAPSEGSTLNKMSDKAR